MRVMMLHSWRMRAPQRGAIWRDRRGVSAIEFALIAPILFLLYIGTVEIGNLLTLARRVETVASAASDLTAQVKQVVDNDLKDICDAAKSILTPYDSAPLKIVLSSVVADQNNNGKVAWSFSEAQHCGGGSLHAVGSAYALPSGTTVANSSVIVAEVTYAYKPILDLNGVFSPGAFNLQRTFYTRPRRSPTVAKN
jgi:Flp pilus assembly protein TadG